MGTLGILYLVFGILYMLACIADGQDVKPLWKRWLGGKLERYADKLKPIDYCNMRGCRYYQEHVERRDAMIPIDYKRIESCVQISEGELHEARIMEDMMRRRGETSMTPANFGISRIVERAKKDCIYGIMREVEKNNLLNVKVDSESRYPETIVRGFIYVGRFKEL